MLVGASLGGFVGFIAKDLQITAFVPLWSSRASMIITLVAVGALLGIPRLGRWLLVGLTAFMAALWLMVAFTPLSMRLASGLVRRDAPAHADAAYVLSSAMQRDGDPTTAAEARLLGALTLVGEGFTNRIVVSEVSRPGPGYTDWARQQVSRLHLGAEVLDAGLVANTREEALAVAELCRKRGWRRLLLVTSPTHTRRATLSFEHTMKGMGITLIVIPCVETHYDLESLKLPDERIAAFGPLMRERIGLLVYRHRGWIEP